MASHYFIVLLSLSSVCPAPTENLIPGTGILTNMVSKGQQMMELWLTEYTTAPYTVTAGPFEGGLEERTYPSMMWVCNKRTESDLADGQTSKLFWPLFQYIQGSNVGNLFYCLIHFYKRSDGTHSGLQAEDCQEEDKEV